MYLIALPEYGVNDPKPIHVFLYNREGNVVKAIYRAVPVDAETMFQETGVDIKDDYNG